MRQTPPPPSAGSTHSNVYVWRHCHSHSYSQMHVISITHRPSCTAFTSPKSHNHTHLILSLYIPFTPLTLCLVSSLHGRYYRPRRPVPQPCIPLLGFPWRCFHPSKLPVHWLPTQQALFCSLVRVPSYSLGVSLVSVRLLVSPGLCSALLVTHFLSVLALDSVILFTYCLLLVSCSF